MVATADIVGRGNREGAELIRRWFMELDQVAAQNGKAAYVFVMGSFVELLRAFDFAVVFNEITSLQTAVRKVSQDYIKDAEDYGYSADVCGYVKADVGLQLRNGQHPMGRIPRPSLAIATNACNTYIKWGEIWERMYKIPVFVIDIPGSRQAGVQSQPGDADFEEERRYVEVQLRELIRLCEEISGVPFDLDRLRENLAHANRMARCYKRVLELNQSRPALFNALSDGTVYLGVANIFRGTAAGSRYFEELVEELEFKAAQGIGALPEEERFRLIQLGTPCYPLFRRYVQMFAQRGGNFVAGTYPWFASGGFNLGLEYDLERPLESMAEVLLISVRDGMDSMFFPHRVIPQLVQRYQVDGVVFHGVKSCRTTSSGLADMRRFIGSTLDIPTLFLESELVDPRVVAEAQLKNRIEAFLEGLEARRQQKITTRGGE